MDKKRKEVKEANIGFIDLVPLLFTVPFLWVFSELIQIKELFIVLYFLFFSIIAIAIIYYFYFRKIKYNIKVKKYGEKVHAKVVGYVDDDTTLINGFPAQIIQLLIKTGEKEKTIYYQTYKTKKKYEVNSEIELLKYNDIYYIIDRSDQKKEKIICSLVNIILIIIACRLIANIIIYYVYNTSYYEIKMSYIQKNNKEIMTKLKNLEYKIPDDYKLSVYKKDSNYEFKSKSESHFCTIDIHLYNSEDDEENINTCSYYDINKRYVNDEEIVINGTTWCRSTQLLDEDSFGIYYMNNGKEYYSIKLYNYNDKDEKCYMDLSEFVKTIKYN